MCVGKCFAIISSHVSFPISVYFTDGSFNVVALGWMLLVRFFIFLAIASSSATVSLFMFSYFFLAFLFCFLYSAVFYRVFQLFHFSCHFCICHRFWLPCVSCPLVDGHQGLLGAILLALAAGQDLSSALVSM